MRPARRWRVAMWLCSPHFVVRHSKSRQTTPHVRHPPAILAHQPNLVVDSQPCAVAQAAARASSVSVLNNTKGERKSDVPLPATCHMLQFWPTLLLGWRRQDCMQVFACCTHRGESLPQEKALLLVAELRRHRQHADSSEQHFTHQAWCRWRVEAPCCCAGWRTVAGWSCSQSSRNYRELVLWRRRCVVRPLSSAPRGCRPADLSAPARPPASYLPAGLPCVAESSRSTSNLAGA